MIGDKKQVEIIEKPRICCIDLKDEVIEALEAVGMNLYKDGTLGAKIHVPKRYNDDYTPCASFSNE